jgi:hypothetical protein
LTQDAGWFTQDVIDTANSILGSGMARYLSGTGRNTLARQSGRTATGIVAAAGSPVISLPFQSDRFQIMVNNPAEDTFAFADVSS